MIACPHEFGEHIVEKEFMVEEIAPLQARAGKLLQAIYEFQSQLPWPPSCRNDPIIRDGFQSQPKQWHLGAKHSIIKLRMRYIPCSKCTSILQRGTHMYIMHVKSPVLDGSSTELLKVLIKEAEGCFPICTLQMCHQQQQKISTFN